MESPLLFSPGIGVGTVDRRTVARWEKPVIALQRRGSNVDRELLGFRHSISRISASRVVTGCGSTKQRGLGRPSRLSWMGPPRERCARARDQTGDGPPACAARPALLRRHAIDAAAGQQCRRCSFPLRTSFAGGGRARPPLPPPECASALHVPGPAAFPPAGWNCGARASPRPGGRAHRLRTRRSGARRLVPRRRN